MSVTIPRPLVLLAAGGLLLLAVVYQGKGNLDLVWGTDRGSAVDLYNRDVEHSLFTDGKNPFDHKTGSQPPWGYPTGILFTWPPWPAVRAYFAVVNLAALLVVAWWAGRAAPADRPEIRWLLMAAVSAFGGACTATEVGQVGIVVTALLALALWCDERGHDVATGLLVAVALIKPTISGPFAVALLLTGRYRAATVAAAYGAVASGIAWGVTGVPPWRMLAQMVGAAGGYVNDGTFGLVEVLGPLGVPARLVNPVAALLVTVPGIAAMLLARRSLPLAFAIAALWGRLWTYHKSYDDIMLVFVLVPLGVLAFRHARASVPALVAFGAMGLLAWIPGRVLAIEAVQMAQLAIWPVALLMVLAAARGDRAYLASLR
jgi:hypothetical protein